MMKMVGEYGTASLVPAENFPDRPRLSVSWVVTAPLWHPLWSQYLLSAVSLADTPGEEPAVKESPEMTHEILVVALNPEAGEVDAALVTDENPVWFLLPPNIVEQITTTDEVAADLCHNLAHAVVEGMLCPETIESPEGIQQMWRTVIHQTLDHYRDPHHGRMN